MVLNSKSVMQIIIEKFKTKRNMSDSKLDLFKINK